MACEAVSEHVCRKSSWSSAERSERAAVGVLGFLRALVLSMPLFFYTWLGRNRDFPPLVPYSYLLIIAILGVWWLCKVAYGRPLARSPLALPLTGLVAASTVSTVFSIDRRLSIDALLATVALVLFFFLFCDLLLIGWSSSTFVNALLIFVSLLIVQSVWEIGSWYWTWYMLRVEEYPSFLIPYRLFGVADHPNLLASLVAIALPFAIMRLAFARRLPIRILWALWLLAAEVVLFYTRSRGGMIASCVVIAVVVSWILIQRFPFEAIGNRKHVLLKYWLCKSWHISITTFLYVTSFVLLFLFSEATSQSTFSTSGGSIISGASRFTFWHVAWANFLAHPLTGSGPLTYGRVYVDSVEAIRNWIAPHAHNLMLNTITEQGMIGGLALVWVATVSGMTVGRRWRWRPHVVPAEEQDRQVLLVSVTAALAGFLVHCQFDMLTWGSANALVVMLLLALAMHAAGRLHQNNQRMSRWTALPCAAVVFLAVVISRYGEGQKAMFEAIQASRAEQWAQVAKKLDQAVHQDPSFGFYYSQRGYAYGMLALPLDARVDATAAAEALTSYEEALSREPQYVPHLLNMAALLDAQGLTGAAEQKLTAAVAKGVDWALPALLLGERYERRGEFAEAQRLFEVALTREAHVPNMVACRRSPICREVAATFVRRRQSSGTEPIAHLHKNVNSLLVQGRPQEALRMLDQVPVSSSDPRPWLDRSAAHLALGQIPQARLSLRIADILNVNLPPTAAEAALVRSDLAVATGNAKAAIEALESVVKLPTSDITYSYNVFWRFGLPGTLFPQLSMLQRTSSDIAVYQKLATLYHQENRHNDAIIVEQQLEMLRALFESADK